MLHLLIQSVSCGTDAVLGLTRQFLENAIADKGDKASISFPGTNYYFPLINALLNIEVRNFGDCLEALEQAEGLSKGNLTKSGLVISGLGGALNKGVSTLICEEILASSAILNKEHLKEGCSGFISDNVSRSLGLRLIDGRISGIALILGPAKDAPSALELVRSFQARNIVTLLAGNVQGNTFKKQLESKGMELGLENYVVPLGEDYLSAIYALNFVARVPLIYGGFKAGQWQGIVDYIRNRLPAFVLLLGYTDEIIAAASLGTLAFGLPIITDLDLPQLGKAEEALYEALVTEKDYKKIPPKCILTRGIKIKITEVKIPVPYAAAFEGERIKKEDLFVGFGAKAGVSFEFLTTKKPDEIEDGKVELFGPDVEQLEKSKEFLPLALIVEVCGSKMRNDFEPILERCIHRYINYASGITHALARDMNVIRISKDAFNKGFRLKHIGVILHAMLHREYGAIVDKAQVKLYTRQSDIEKLWPKVKNAYDKRDERLSGMTDKSVDTYYSCLVCQSQALNHVCILTPERLGLCGVYSWMDAKVSFEITPTGPNQPIIKGPVFDERLGQWVNINEFVRLKSNKTIEKVSLYSLMDFPQSACSCFECAVAIVPEANGVIVAHRDYSGMTPCGMTFTALAGLIGTGAQTPGFLGIGKSYILSKKFISAEGGLRRLLWMPKELKEALADKLRKRCFEIGEPDLINKIADETIATNSEELLRFLKEKQHPALKMEPMV